MNQADENPDNEVPVDWSVDGSPTWPPAEPTDAEITDNYRLDHLYTHSFRNGAGKYFTVVTMDEDGTPDTVDAEQPGSVRNKVKTRLTFVKSDDGGRITDILLKRYKFYKKPGYVPQEEEISFSFPFFVGLIGFLQGIAKLNLNDVNERRIPLATSPTLDAETIKRFNTLASTDQGQELIREAVRNGKVTSTDIVNIGYRKAQLEVFESLLSSHEAVAAYRTQHDIRKPGDEAVWQVFFETNTWIFGYGLSFVFNQPLQGEKLEAAVRGHDLGGSGKRPDGVLKTAGIVNSLCLVEIKTPDMLLLESDQYRQDCWAASRELSGAIAQSQKTSQKTLENVALSPVLRPTGTDGSPTGEVVFSYRPKSFLIAGRLSEFSSENGINREKFASFQLLRRNALEPEIITYDELYDRAKFIVSNS